MNIAALLAEAPLLWCYAMKVVIVLHHRFELWTAPPWFSERLRHDFADLEVVQFNDYRGVEDHLRDADIAIAWSLRPEQFRAARKLRWIHSTAAAVHQLMFPELVASHVRVTNSTSIHGPVVAEHAIALVFALAKGLNLAVRYQTKGHWGQQDLWSSTLRPRELAGATLGVIGLGAIGRESVRLAKALGMRVLALREHPEKGSEGADRVFGPAQLDQLLEDLLSCGRIHRSCWRMHSGFAGDLIPTRNLNNRRWLQKRVNQTFPVHVFSYWQSEHR